MNHDYPKILIIGETFHRKSGGGITLSNLFKNWPKNRLSNAMDYYREDMEAEFKDINFIELYNYKKIFGIFRYDNLGRFRHSVDQLNNKIKDERKKASFKSKLKKIYFSFLKTTNLIQCIYTYSTTPKLIKKIIALDPDFIYFQPSNREIIKLISEINEKTNIPLAVHIMDDWPSTIASRGLGKRYWSKKIDFELKELFEKCSLFFSISEEMSEEYLRRYQKKFVPFHNPISFEKWSNLKRSTLNLSSDRPIRILHAGRIGTGIQSSVLEVSKVIQTLKEEGINVIFELQSTNIEEDFIQEISNYGATKINPTVPYEKVAEVIASADMLILCNDFDEEGKKFLKYSMPTKASEYMISKVPILVYSDSSSAIYKHALKHKWAYTVGVNKTEILKAGIEELINNDILRKLLSNNAYEYSEKNFEENIVLEKFRNMFFDRNTL